MNVLQAISLLRRLLCFDYKAMGAGFSALPDMGQGNQELESMVSFIPSKE